MNHKVLSKPSDAATRWISVDWDKLPPSKTVSTIYKILTAGNPNRMIVSNVGGLKERMARWIDLHELDLTVPAVMDYSEDIRNRLGSEYQAPQGETEKQLVSIWQNFFGINAIGVKDSFFELGGDSLKALSLLNVIRKTLKKEVTLRELMDHSSIDKLAALLGQKSGDYQSVSEFRPDPNNLDKPFPLTDVQFAYWIGRSDVLELGNIAAHGYQENDLVDFDYERFSLAFNTMIKRHSTLRMVVLDSGEQIICPSKPVYAIPVLDLRGKSTSEIVTKIREIRNEMSHHVFDSQKWPLFEIRATKISDRLTRIHFSFDGLVLDGPSTRILYSELYRLYVNPEEELQPLSLNFRDYVLALEEQRNLVSFQEKKAYWEVRIPDFPPGPELPTLHRISASEGPIFTRYNHILKKESWDKLKQLCRDNGFTQNSLLLAVYNEALLAWSRNKRYALNLTFFQRDPNIHPQVNEIIGDFTSLILLEIDNTEPKILADRIDSIQEQLWKDIDNSAYSGIRVIRDITRLRKSQAAARYPVVFTSLLSMEDMELEPHNPGSVESRHADLKEIPAWQDEHSEELETFEISQTPQVTLDHQVSESGGELHIAWDVREGIFPAGMIKDMFQAFCGLLDKLALEPAVLGSKEPLGGMTWQNAVSKLPEESWGIGEMLRRLKDAEALQTEEKRREWVMESLTRRLLGDSEFYGERLPVSEDFRKREGIGQCQALPFHEFSSLLNYFAPVQNDYVTNKFRYASAGGLYPVDIYLAVNKGGIESLPEGMYYLDKENSVIYRVNERTWVDMPEDMNVSLMLVGSFGKIQALYGEESYGFMNIEAGIVTQGMKTEVDKRSWQLSLLYGMDIKDIEQQLGLNSHQLILNVLGISLPNGDHRERELHHTPMGNFPNDLMRRLNVIDYNRNQFPLIIDPIRRYQFKQKQVGRAVMEQEKKIDLAIQDEAADESSLSAISSRRSYRNFVEDKILLANFRSLLEDLTCLAKDKDKSFPYISYCNLHALKLYFIVKENRIEGVKPGVYRFESIGGQWTLTSETVSDAQVQKLYDNEVNSPTFKGAAFGIYLTVDLTESLPLYGDRAMEYAYFEAGALCHFLETNGPAQQIGFCQIGGLDQEYLLRLLQAGEGELYLHSILGGNITAVQAHESASHTDPMYSDSSIWKKRTKYKESLLHTPYLEQVQKNGDAIALTAGDKEFTYKELDSMSEVLATELRRKGVVPNSLVAVLMTKGWEQVVSVLGILKAGGAYLPIDAELPRDRIDYILESGEVRIVLSQKEFAGERDNMVINKELLTGDPGSERLPDIMLTGDELAYVIFTSGSTGNPKGVMISHSGARNTILAINSLYSVTERDRVIALSSLDFDLSVYDIFGTLAAGGTLVIPDKTVLKDPALLYQVMKQEQITVWNSVPAYLKMFVTYMKENQQSLDFGLRLVLLSGDWIPISMLREIRTINKEIEIISLGGATEASIWSIYYPITEIDPQWRSIPYGTALPNQTVYILDSNLSRGNILNPGEICIGGDGLAKGYWKDSEKTKAHFVVHPVTGERLYKTGDIGQYLPDGNIEIMGRLDFQVKIQGFRIELGEIELNLLNHDDVQDAIVMPHGERNEEKKLVAYVILRQEAAPSISELKAYLASMLPHYMVPGMFFFMDVFPLTSNGKINRGALPKPSLILENEISYMNPSTAAQKKLLAIWKNKLNLEKVGITNNFFEVGGDSLMLLEIHREIKKQFNMDFPVIELFRFPTIESLTENLDFDSDMTEQKDIANKNRDSAKARAEFRKNLTRNRI
ncbi:amino acid adenylation domain-containing protein [Paenibacillus amylolyticus]